MRLIINAIRSEFHAESIKGGLRARFGFSPRDPRRRVQLVEKQFPEVFRASGDVCGETLMFAKIVGIYRLGLQTDFKIIFQNEPGTRLCGRALGLFACKVSASREPGDEIFLPQQR